MDRAEIGHRHHLAGPHLPRYAQEQLLAKAASLGGPVKVGQSSVNRGYWEPLAPGTAAGPFPDR